MSVLGELPGRDLPSGVSASDQPTIKEFIPDSWFHPVGIYKVLARLWDRLPDVGASCFSPSRWIRRTTPTRRPPLKTAASGYGKCSTNSGME